MKWLTDFFQLNELKTNLRTEVLAGLTTYLTMSYIIFVNPAILAKTGMNEGAVFTATCFITAFSSLLIAFIAKAPIAIAPGMAINTYFSFVVVQTLGFSWQAALGMVFISGLAFFLLTLTNIRALLIASIPKNMNIAILCGISLLIALIALKNNHIISISSNTLIQLGDLNNFESLMFFLGFMLIIIFDFYHIRGAILLSIVIVSLIHCLYKDIPWEGFVTLPPSIAPTFLKLNFHELNTASAFKPVFSFFLIALFDATGTFIGLLNQSFFQGSRNIKKTIEKSLLADSIATTSAALLGSSSTSPFIESAAGIEEGGRSGLTALVVSLLFLLSLFIFPLTRHIPDAAVGAALLYVACCMLKEIAKLDTHDMSEFIPAVITLLMIPFSFSIADGIGIGIITYTLLKIFTKKFNELNITLGVLSLIFVLYFI